MEKIRRMGAGLTRAVVAALAITAMASVPHADAQRRATEAAETAQEATAVEGVVNIQTASPEELQRLPGIGPSKAAAIVAQRDRTPFRRVEDILRVRGIGRATFRRLRPMITVSGATTLASDVRMPRTRRAEPDAEEVTDSEP